MFLISDGILPANTQEIAEVTTTRVDPECYVPPRPGEPAHRATGGDRDAALYFDQMDARIPAGTGRDGEPIFLNLEFLDGTRGAHVSISGISGVATKTISRCSCSTPCSAPRPRCSRVNAKALIFSVKGEDLLFLDKANTRLNDGLRGAYARLGLPAAPFASAGFFAPPCPATPPAAARDRPRVGRQCVLVDARGVLRPRAPPLRVRGREDEKNQYTMVVHQGHQQAAPRKPRPTGSTAP